MECLGVKLVILGKSRGYWTEIRISECPKRLLLHRLYLLRVVCLLFFVGFYIMILSKLQVASSKNIGLNIGAIFENIGPT